MWKMISMVKMLSVLILPYLVLSPNPSLAIDVDLSVPCSETGEINISGAWDSQTGAFDFALTSSDCVQGNVQVDGNGTATGTFILNILPTTAAVDAVTDFQGTLTRGQDTVYMEFSKTVHGTYDLLSSQLSGDIQSTWSGSGAISISIEELLAVDWLQALF